MFAASAARHAAVSRRAPVRVTCAPLPPESTSDIGCRLPGFHRDWVSGFPASIATQRSGSLPRRLVLAMTSVMLDCVGFQLRRARGVGPSAVDQGEAQLSFEKLRQSTAVAGTNSLSGRVDQDGTWPVASL